jgi:ribosome production factor 2
MVFNGPLFDTHPRYQHLKNLMLDFFRGKAVSSMELDGLQHVISLSAGEQTHDPSSAKEALPVVLFRVYCIQSKKVVGSKVSRIELEEMGPRLDLMLGRCQEAREEMMSLALKKPKETTVCYLVGTLIIRLRQRRMSKLIRWEINWAESMLAIRIWGSCKREK